MDVSQMSGFTQAAYLTIIYSALGAVLYWFYNRMVTKKEIELAEENARRDAKAARKAKKNKWSHILDKEK